MARRCSVSFEGRVLVQNVLYCASFYERMRGLMFRRKQGALLVGDKESILSSSIHMFFVFFPLDIFWLDKEMRVVDVQRNVRPFFFHAQPKVKAQYVLELPVGANRIALGDILKVQVPSLGE